MIKTIKNDENKINSKRNKQLNLELNEKEESMINEIKASILKNNKILREEKFSRQDTIRYCISTEYAKLNR